MVYVMSHADQTCPTVNSAAGTQALHQNDIFTCVHNMVYNQVGETST